MKNLALALSMTTMLASIGALQAKPFHHKFGELREYHKDWLAVCPDRFDPQSTADYERTCWASTFTGNPDGTISGDFPGNRLSVSRDRETGKFAITFVSDAIEAIDQTRPVRVYFSDGHIHDYTYGTDVTPNKNSGNEYTFTNPQHVADIINRMKQVGHLRIILPLKNGKRDMQFSAMGFTSALGFTEKYAKPQT